MGPGTEVPEQLVANSNTRAPYSGDSAFRVERATVPRGAEVVVSLRSSILVVVPQRVSLVFLEEGSIDEFTACW